MAGVVLTWSPSWFSSLVYLTSCRFPDKYTPKLYFAVSGNQNCIFRRNSTKTDCLLKSTQINHQNRIIGRPKMVFPYQSWPWPNFCPKSNKLSNSAFGTTVNNNLGFYIKTTLGPTMQAKIPWMADCPAILASYEVLCGA